ncbi:MAG TPA: hypothetical protein VMN60_13955 [Longimicrobiales bacterium]|nr:hypothetical protein [Longimicrobiales bacterium]
MTRLRLLRRITIGYFAAYAVFVTFPGVAPFRGPRPFILGMPLPLVWVALWVIGGFFVLLALDRAYRAAHAEE